MSDATPQPPSLAAYLDAGCSLDDVSRVHLLDELVTDYIGAPPPDNTPVIGVALERGDRALATFFRWQAELLDPANAELVERYKAARGLHGS